MNSLEKELNDFLNEEYKDMENNYQQHTIALGLGLIEKIRKKFNLKGFDYK